MSSCPIRLCTVGGRLLGSSNVTALCMRPRMQLSHNIVAISGQQPNSDGFRRQFNTQYVPPSRSTSTMLLYSVGVGAAIGVGWAGYSSWSRPKPGTTQTHPAFFVDRIPDVPITRRLQNPRDKSDLGLVLFQYQTCPFCCKVRAFLDSQGLSYSVVEVDAVLRQSIKWSPYKKVPMLLAKCKDGRYIQLTESSMIVSILASVLADPSKDVAELYNFYPTETFVDESGSTRSEVLNKYFLMLDGQKVPKPAEKEAMEDERKWRAWADSHLVHLISPNVYTTWPEALETFNWFAKTGDWDITFPRWERNLMVYVGAAAMWAISKRLKKRHGLSDDVRWHLYNACDKWTEELAKRKTRFLGGNKVPNLADVSVFGVLSSMEGCQAFKDCLKNTDIAPWFNAMKEYVRHHRAAVVSKQSTTISASDAQFS